MSQAPVNGMSHLADESERLGVHPLGCPSPPNTLKGGHQTSSQRQDENCCHLPGDAELSYDHAGPVLPPSPLAPGHGSLKVQLVSGQSAAISSRASSPLKLLLPHPRGQSVWCYLSSLGGGFVAGDETKLAVELGANTRCYLGTQASTKVFRNPHRRACGHTLHASLARNSLLVVAPDPVQSFAGSSYAQCQQFHLQAGASLVLVDWFTSGRTACGERWAFSRFRTRNDLFIGSDLVLADSLLLDPEHGSLDGAHRMGRFNCLALVVLVGDAVRPDAERLLAEIAAQPIALRLPLVCSASPIRQGAVLRVAGESVEAVGREIHRHLGFLRDVLGDDPLARKW